MTHQASGITRDDLNKMAEAMVSPTMPVTRYHIDRTSEAILLRLGVEIPDPMPDGFCVYGVPCVDCRHPLPKGAE